jgi:hypothetical protein
VLLFDPCAACGPDSFGHSPKDAHMITSAATVSNAHALPMHGAHNPSTDAQGTTPGSFARRADVGGPLAFSSPDTPGMPAPSAKTAWDFLPEGWSMVTLAAKPEGAACGCGKTHEDGKACGCGGKGEQKADCGCGGTVKKAEAATGGCGCGKGYSCLLAKVSNFACEGVYVARSLLESFN